MVYTLCKEEITDEDFKPEIEKFNKEIRNMEICICENSVIYLIIMILKKNL